MGCVVKLCEPTIVKCNLNDFFQSEEEEMLEIELKRKTIGLYIPITIVSCEIIFKILSQFFPLEPNPLDFWGIVIDV